MNHSSLVFGSRVQVESVKNSLNLAQRLAALAWSNCGGFHDSVLFEHFERNRLLHTIQLLLQELD